MITFAGSFFWAVLEEDDVNDPIWRQMNQI